VIGSRAIGMGELAEIGRFVGRWFGIDFMMWKSQP
jgi:hypothetical protein